MAQAYGLYTHIRSNRVRSTLLLVGLFFLVYVMVFAGALIARAMTENAPLSGYLQGAARDLLVASPFATAATAAWVWLALQYNQSLIDLVTGGRAVTRPELPRLYNLLENLCISRGIPMPRLKVMESSALNAFASGVKPEQYAVTVTTGLLDALDDAELEAVLGHELTHIRNGDVRMLVIAVIVAGVIGFFAEMVFRVLGNFSGSGWGSGRSSQRSRDDGKSSGGAAAIAILIALALIALAWALSIVIRFALSRSREYLADAGSVELTKNPDAMISALRKIDGRGELPGAPSGIMEMCVDNPRSGFVDLFATHPAIEKRIDALVRVAGGRDPGPIMLPQAADGPPALEAPPSGTPMTSGVWSGGTPLPR